MQKLLSRIEAQLAGLAIPITVALPDGRRVVTPCARVTLTFSEWRGLAKLAARQIGAVSEDFVEGRVALEGSMRDLIAVVVGLLPGSPIETDSGWCKKMLHRANSCSAHTLSKDVSQIEFHYDISDEFYALWLDPKRVYSCAYFRTTGETLAQAQEAKLDYICRKLMLQPGERFLDIGSGWGGLLFWAAEHYGVDATGNTLSRNQQVHVQGLIDAKGLGRRVRVKLQDYRNLTAERPFDKISSVGMFEHVGSANMSTYFQKVFALLKPGGLVLNHGITSAQPDHRQLGAGMGDFIEKYIFPGGELLHVTHILREMARAGLEMVDTESLRPHYARTLWAWSDALEAQLPEALAILQAHHGGPPHSLRPGQHDRAERILRAYRLYLAGSAMSFEQAWISLHQILAIRPDGKVAGGPMPGAQSAYPFVRDHLYK